MLFETEYPPPPPPPRQWFIMTPVTNYILLYKTLPCKKIARAPGVIKDLCSLSAGGGGGVWGKTE